MARTKREIDHEQKRSEIVRAARELFLEHGFEATSIQRLAKQVEVTPNTLYWYFADKDALLVAVMQGITGEGLAEYERRRSSSLEAQLRWLFGLFWEMQTLVSTVHTRMHLSPSLRAWHETFHRLLEGAVVAELRARGLSVGHEAATARCISFITEGIVAHQCSKAEQRRIIKSLIAVVEPQQDKAVTKKTR